MKMGSAGLNNLFLLDQVDDEAEDDDGNDSYSGWAR